MAPSMWLHSNADSCCTLYCVGPAWREIQSQPASSKCISHILSGGNQMQQRDLTWRMHPQ
jgi:hypothetical protein